MIHLMYTTCSVWVDLTMYADIRCLALYMSTCNNRVKRIINTLINYSQNIF